MIDTSDWTYNDFLTYLLLMAASADLHISEEEREVIVTKVGEEEFKRIKRQFEKHNDAQSIDIITELYSRFEDQIGGKEKLVRELRNLLTVENRSEHVMDRYMLMMLKKIL